MNRSQQDALIKKRIQDYNFSNPSSMQTQAPVNLERLLLICQQEVSPLWMITAPVVGYLASMAFAL